VSEAEPLVQILILDSSSPEEYTPAVHLDLQESDASQDRLAKQDQQLIEEDDTIVPPSQAPGFDERAPETPADAGLEADPAEAAQAPEPAPDVQEASEQQKLQELWLQLQQGQREWQERQIGVEGTPMLPKAPVCSYPTAPAEPVPIRPAARVRLPETEPSRRLPPVLQPVAPDPLPAPPTGPCDQRSTPGSSPQGQEVGKGKDLRGEHMYRRKWNPRIAMEQRREREKLRPAAIPTRPTPAAVEDLVKGEDLGPEPNFFTEPTQKLVPMETGPTRPFLPPAEDGNLEDMEFARLQKMISETMATAEAEVVEGQELGAANAGFGRSAGLSLGAAPEPPRRMANIRAAAEQRLQQNSLRDAQTFSQDHDMLEPAALLAPSEKPRQDIRSIAERRSGGLRLVPSGGNRTPGSATRTPTPRGGVYKPAHLYSGRGAAEKEI